MTRERWVWWPLRVCATLAATLICLQPVFAGQFLAGTYEALRVHRENATVAGIAVAVTALSAVPLWRPGRGPWWPIVAFLGLFALIGLQIALGFQRAVAIHVPLGLAIVALAVRLAIWTWQVRS